MVNSITCIHSEIPDLLAQPQLQVPYIVGALVKTVILSGCILSQVWQQNNHNHEC